MSFWEISKARRRVRSCHGVGKFAVAVAGCAIAVGSVVASPPSFSGLQFLPGGSSSAAWSVSGDGSVVVGYSATANGYHAFRWTRSGGLQDLGALASNSAAGAVSTNGSAVAGQNFSQWGSGDVAFRWSDGDGMISLGIPDGGNYSNSQGMSGDGTVIVGQCGVLGSGRAFRWTLTEGMVSLGTLPGFDFSAAHDANSDGSVVVGQCGHIGSRAFRWTIDGGMEDLGVLAGGTWSSATAVSPDGQRVSGTSDSAAGVIAFVWNQDDGMVRLGTLPGGTWSYGYDLSGNGSAVVGWGDSANGERAFIWTDALGMVDLNTFLPTLGLDLTGWTLNKASSVSDDGLTITGEGVHNGLPEGWIATIGLPCDAIITNQPQSVALLPNSTAIFEVTVSGAVTGYQWRKNNSNLSDDGRIEGAQSPVLTLAGVQSDDQGSYDCVVSNACGSITSDPAQLSCEPIITQQPPASAVLHAGLQLSVTVPSGAPYSYRWRQNGQNLFNIAGLIGGATTRTLILFAVDPSLAGTYDCVLTDVCGETLSDPTQAYCPADFDQDGFISGVDFDDYVSAFEGGDIRADFDRDGFLTGIDYDDFVRAFEAGC